MLIEHGTTDRTLGGGTAAPVVRALPERYSARELLSKGQRGALVAAAAGLAILLGVHWFDDGIGAALVSVAGTFVAVSTFVYILVLVFRVVVVFAADGADVLSFTGQDLRSVLAAGMPTYTVLVPLYREGKVLPALVEKLSRLRYPKDKLQILLLIEEDDDETRASLAVTTLPRFFEVVLVPPSQPRTKPKACNYGLTLARGDFCVIFDAEDRPDVDQLLKAVAAFRRLPPSVVCVQAELQYWNQSTNWLTRFFTAEYAVNFSLWLRGLDRFRLPILLGGTSNHFRTDALRELGAWDPHNVTEDADLGVRIARHGWSVRMMSSVTEEEANSKVGNWVRQRSRWIKGFYQTYLVHMRSPIRLLRDLGLRRFVAFQLTLGLPTLTGLLNPIFWTLTLVYLVNGPDRIEPLFPPLILALGVIAMLIGNLLMIFTFMIGCMERGLYRLVSPMLVVPIYWILMSVAAYKAFIQLLRPSKRHYWELTEHGLVDEEQTRDLRSVPAPAGLLVPVPGRPHAVRLAADPVIESSA